MENTESTIKLSVDTEELDKKVQDAENEFQEKSKEISEKKYAVTANVNFLEDLKNFIHNDAPFKGAESLGIVQLKKELSSTKVKSSNILLSGLAIQAINYFLMNFEGKGIESAEKISSMIKPINQALVETNEDNRKLKHLEIKLNAMRQGLNVDELAEETGDKLKEENNDE
jgi:CRISPR/Cas system-associated exonuclease Cas4 (RecB family)